MSCCSGNNYSNIRPHWLADLAGALPAPTLAHARCGFQIPNAVRPLYSGIGYMGGYRGYSYGGGYGYGGGCGLQDYCDPGLDYDCNACGFDNNVYDFINYDSGSPLGRCGVNIDDYNLI